MAKPNSKASVGEGGRFAALKQKLARRGDVSNPGAVAAAIGRKKYGASRFAKMSAAGRKSAHGSGQFSKADIDKGYMVVKAPEFVPAWNSKEAPDRAEQSVKGKSGGAPREAKQVAGVSGLRGTGYRS